MPIYECETAAGVRVEVWRPVSLRDDLPAGYRRVMPSRLGVIVGEGTPDPGAVAQAVPRALKQIEQTMGHDRMAAGTGFSTKQMKRVWKI